MCSVEVAFVLFQAPRIIIDWFIVIVDLFVSKYTSFVNQRRLCQGYEVLPFFVMLMSVENLSFHVKFFEAVSTSSFRCAGSFTSDLCRLTVNRDGIQANFGTNQQ